MSDYIHLDWEGSEFDYIPKNKDWYIRIGAGAAVLALISIFLLKNFLLAMFIIVAALVLFVLGTKKPRTLHFAITKSGFHIEDTLYPYSNLESFWIREQPHGNVLVLKTEAYLTPYLMAPMGDIDVEEMRLCLLEYIDEEEHPERLSEVISDTIRF